MDDVTERFLTETQVSRLIGRAVQSLRNDRCRNRGIPYHKFGKSVRYWGPDVIAYAKARRIATSDQK